MIAVSANVPIYEENMALLARSRRLAEAESE
jgi:hypothetical protein